MLFANLTEHIWALSLSVRLSEDFPNVDCLGTHSVGLQQVDIHIIQQLQSHWPLSCLAMLQQNPFDKKHLVKTFSLVFHIARTYKKPPETSKCSSNDLGKEVHRSIVGHLVGLDAAFTHRVEKRLFSKPQMRHRHETLPVSHIHMLLFS